MPIEYCLTPPKTADCVIVGGGILGAATAFFARRAGVKCLIIERRPALCTLTTPVSTGAFRAQFDNPEEIELVQESIGFFDAFEENTGIRGGIDVHHQGYLWLTTSGEGATRQKQMVEMQHQWGLKDVELLSGEEARSRFPYLSPSVVSARFRQKDGWLDVKKLTMGLAESSGAQVCTDTEVTGFGIEGNMLRSVKTSKGEVQCGLAVIAAGPFSGALAARAGIELPLTLRIRQKLVFPELADVPQDAPMTIDEDTGAHWRPTGRGAFLLFTQHDSPEGPPLDNVPTSADFYFALLRPDSPTSVSRISPFWKRVWDRNTDPWLLIGGQYTYTPDHRPFLGPTPIAGLHLNCGYSGHGIMGSIGGSRIAVDAITGKLAASENPFRLGRPMESRVKDVL